MSCGERSWRIEVIAKVIAETSARILAEVQKLFKVLAKILADVFLKQSMILFFLAKRRTRPRGRRVARRSAESRWKAPVASHTTLSNPSFWTRFLGSNHHQVFGRVDTCHQRYNPFDFNTLQ